MKNKSKTFTTYLLIILMLVLTSSSLSLIGIFMGKVVTAISNLDMGQFKSNLLKLGLLVLVNFLSSNLHCQIQTCFTNGLINIKNFGIILLKLRREEDNLK